MELLVEIPDERARELQLTGEKISLAELEKILAGQRLHQALLNAHESAKMYGIDKWTMDDINQLIKEAGEEYEKEKSSC